MYGVILSRYSQCDTSSTWREDWKQLAAEEKDPEKVRLLIDKLIEALGQEQTQVREEIKKRLAHSAENKEPKV